MLGTSNCFRSEEATQQYFTMLNQCLLNIKTRVSVASKTRRKILIKNLCKQFMKPTFLHKLQLLR